MYAMYNVYTCTCTCIYSDFEAVRGIKSYTRTMYMYRKSYSDGKRTRCSIYNVLCICIKVAYRLMDFGDRGTADL